MFTHYQEQNSNTTFTGWIGQRHETGMSGCCLSKLDGEMLWNLAEAIKKVKIFNLIRTCDVIRF